jgi:nicotinamidase-related amidase/type 1 glutamine amidotransferase
MTNFADYRLLKLSLVLLLTGVSGVFAKDDPIAKTSTKAGEKAAGRIQMTARQRVKGDDGVYTITNKNIQWDPKKTAVVICDMWDQHWCAGATRRVADMAPRMNEVVNTLRDKGALIIHAPSDTMKHYQETAPFKLAQQAPKIETQIKLQRWCHLDKKREAGLPIDDSDGGCDCEPTCKTRRAWSKQIDTIKIKSVDAITDSPEAYYLMKQRGIENVVVMGVHTNMCVLGRPFSLRQMVYQGQNVVLMRDLTDTMYNSRSKPFVDHHTGTDLVVEHIEKFWVPTVTSDQIVGGKPFRYKDDTRKHMVMVIAEREYKTNKTLPVFAAKYLGKHFRVTFVYADPKDRNNLSGIEALDDADIALISVRRRVPSKAQLDVLRRFIKAGKPVVAVRTSSHAFNLRGKKPPAGHDDWPQWDAEVMGGHYTGHHGHGPKVAIKVATGAKDHPILAGIDVSKLVGHGSLYKVSPLGKSATALLIGSIEGKPAEPVAWTNKHIGGGRTFYTPLAHADDFKDEAFNQLLLNGIYWAAGVKQAK